MPSLLCLRSFSIGLPLVFQFTSGRPSVLVPVLLHVSLDSFLVSWVAFSRGCFLPPRCQKRVCAYAYLSFIVLSSAVHHGPGHLVLDTNLFFNRLDPFPFGWGESHCLAFLIVINSSPRDGWQNSTPHLLGNICSQHVITLSFILPPGGFLH